MSAIDRIKTELRYYRALAAHPSVPKTSKWLLVCAIGYLLSPVDLIPDWIPVMGQLDDLIVVPLLVWAALRLIPSDTKLSVRRELQRNRDLPLCHAPAVPVVEPAAEAAAPPVPVRPGP